MSIRPPLLWRHAVQHAAGARCRHAAASGGWAGGGACFLRRRLQHAPAASSVRLEAERRATARHGRGSPHRQALTACRSAAAVIGFTSVAGIGLGTARVAGRGPDGIAGRCPVRAREGESPHEGGHGCSRLVLSESVREASNCQLHIVGRRCRAPGRITCDTLRKCKVVYEVSKHGKHRTDARTGHGNTKACGV